MDAVILAGGFGKRILPLTHYTPKPMLPVANRPVLDHIAAQTAAAGIDNLIFTLAYMPDVIKAHVGGYIGIKTRCVVETMPLGTAGGVKNAAPRGDFAVLSGDGISDINLSDMIKQHKEAGATVTIAVIEVADLTGYGKIITNGGYVTEIREKDRADEGKRGLANTGIYIVSADALDYADGICDFARDLFPKLLGAGKKIAAYIHSGYWTDIGNCEAYLRANADMLGRCFFPAVRHIGEGAGMEIGTNLIGWDAVVTGRAHSCIIGQNSVVCSGAEIESCVVLPGTIVNGRHSGEIISNNFCFKASAPDVNLLNISNSTKYYRQNASIRL